MKITTLLENTTVDPTLATDHGLSLLIEAEGKTVLFDTGPEALFMANAEILGIDLEQVDHLIVSHGHSDHGGGIDSFLEINTKANVILHQAALDDRHLAVKPPGKTIDIGISSSPKHQERLHFARDGVEIDSRLRVYTDFTKDGFIPSQNANLKKQVDGGEIVSDDFDHEICLLIQSEDKNVIITGCAHSGVGNMIRSVVEKSGIQAPDAVIGGFHLTNPDSKKMETEANMDSLVEELNRYPEAKFYTGHCTGENAHQYLKSKLGDRLREIRTGLTITI